MKDSLVERQAIFTHCEVPISLEYKSEALELSTSEALFVPVVSLTEIASSLAKLSGSKACRRMGLFTASTPDFFTSQIPIRFSESRFTENAKELEATCFLCTGTKGSQLPGFSKSRDRFEIHEKGLSAFSLTTPEAANMFLSNFLVEICPEKEKENEVEICTTLNDLNFSIRELHRKFKIASTELSRLMLKADTETPKCVGGFLTLDEKNRIHLISNDDSSFGHVSILGLFTSDPSLSPKSPFNRRALWSLYSYFARTSDFERLSLAKKRLKFLHFCFSEAKGLECFEVELCSFFRRSVISSLSLLLETPELEIDFAAALSEQPALLFLRDEAPVCESHEPPVEASTQTLLLNQQELDLAFSVAKSEEKLREEFEKTFAQLQNLTSLLTSLSLRNSSATSKDSFNGRTNNFVQMRSMSSSESKAWNLSSIPSKEECTKDSTINESIFLEPCNPRAG